MSGIEKFCRLWAPPVLLEWLRASLGGGNKYVGNYSGWSAAALVCDGYDSDEILSRCLSSAIAVKEGRAAFERDSHLFFEHQYSWPILAGLLRASSDTGGRLDVLDFGGALGSIYFQHKPVLIGIEQLLWSVVEQPNFVEAGRKYIQDEQIRFYESISACYEERHPSIAFLSSVMQYLPEPWIVLDELKRRSIKTVVVDRTPLSTAQSDRVVIQKVSKKIYPAAYPMWVFSRSVFERRLHRDWDILVTTEGPEPTIRMEDGSIFQFSGYVLRSRFNK